MVDINNVLVGIVWTVTVKNEEKIIFTCGACVEGLSVVEQEAREGKKKAMDGANKQGGKNEGEREQEV